MAGLRFSLIAGVLLLGPAAWPALGQGIAAAAQPAAPASGTQAPTQNPPLAGDGQEPSLSGIWVLNGNKLRFESEGQNFKAFFSGCCGERLAVRGALEGRMVDGVYLDNSWSRVCANADIAAWDEWSFTGEIDQAELTMVLQVQKPKVSFTADNLKKTTCRLTGKIQSIWRLKRERGANP